MMRKVTENFYFHEITDSDTAERMGGKVLEKQQNPPKEIYENAIYLIEKTLQPSRKYLNVPYNIESFYRCEELNNKLGGSKTSQHLFGQAADIKILNSQLRALYIDNVIHQAVNYGVMINRHKVNANFILYAHFVMNMEKYDIDQVIHERGTNGNPKWVHVSSSKSKNKRQALIVNQQYPEGKFIGIKEALQLGE